MILVAGATGLLGAEICLRLPGRGLPVRALARSTANPARLEQLRAAGVELVWGDLKDPASLRDACRGADAVISTATSTLSRQSGDSIETVDRHGQIALIDAARAAGVRHFTFVSLPRQPVRESPLTRAKFAAERALIESGMPYTILAGNYFMEVWLSPVLGFDYPNRRAVIFGEGRGLMSWVAIRDVAEIAIRAHQTPGAHNRILPVSGPEALSPLTVVGIFEEAAGAPFERQFFPEAALLAQLETAADPLAETLAKLQLECVNGCVMDNNDTMRLMPMELTSVRQYAEGVIGRKATA
jgi:NADH dehydrogenase